MLFCILELYHKNLFLIAQAAAASELVHLIDSLVALDVKVVTRKRDAAVLFYLARCINRFDLLLWQIAIFAILFIIFIKLFLFLQSHSQVLSYSLMAMGPRHAALLVSPHPYIFNAQLLLIPVWNLKFNVFVL